MPSMVTANATASCASYCLNTVIGNAVTFACDRRPSQTAGIRHCTAAWRASGSTMQIYVICQCVLCRNFVAMFSPLHTVGDTRQAIRWMPLRSCRTPTTWVSLWSTTSQEEIHFQGTISMLFTITQENISLFRHEHRQFTEMKDTYITALLVSLLCCMS